MVGPDNEHTEASHSSTLNARIWPASPLQHPNVFTQPDTLTDRQVADTTSRGWGFVVDTLTYAAVGFGSHHWVATVGNAKWFVTVDDLDARHRDLDDSRLKVRQRLSAALETAHALQQSGKSFVVAPVTSTAGSVLENVDDRFVLALYPHISGRLGSTGRYDSQFERFEVIDRRNIALADLTTKAHRSLTGERRFQHLDISGIAVNLAARVEQAAGDGEMFASSTVRDMMLGGSVTFADCGLRELKGIEGSWRLFRVS